jgi:hypothetical protein
MKKISHFLIVALFLTTPAFPAFGKNTQISNQSKMNSWEDARKAKVKQLQSLINDFRLADNYQDARLFQSSCKKLKIFHRSLPSDTPKKSLLRSASRYCSGRSVPEKLSRWIQDFEVRGFSTCGNPTFVARFVGSYTLNRGGLTAPSRVLEFEYTNLFDERLALISVETLFSPYVGDRWAGIVEGSSDSWRTESVTFSRGESKIIKWQIDEYRFNNFIDRGAIPNISGALTHLLHPKYGGGLYCSNIKAIPMTQ